jgi:hypothetical protein
MSAHAIARRRHLRRERRRHRGRVMRMAEALRPILEAS